MNKKFYSKTIFSNSLPKASDFKRIKVLAEVKNFLIIYDSCLSSHHDFNEWVKKFSFSYAVTAGETLKSIDQFGDHIKKIIEMAEGVSAHELCIVGVGGGSVGDFAGFIASIYKRGTHLIHIPSTWLAAIDSAHGGKTALNVGEYKNQVGTFYPADAIFIARTLFSSLDEQQQKSAYGELLKIALISRSSFFNKLKKSKLFGEDLLWKFLPVAIKAKHTVVRKDPYEKKGFRQLLNLGHTLGHVLESHYGLPHGIAVGYGLRFSLDWSRQRKYISYKKYQSTRVGLLQGYLPKHLMRGNNPLTEKKLKKIVVQDKKSTGKNSVNFVFVEDIGRAFTKKVSFNDLIKEAKRQGWV